MGTRRTAGLRRVKQNCFYKGKNAEQKSGQVCRPDDWRKPVLVDHIGAWKAANQIWKLQNKYPGTTPRRLENREDPLPATYRTAS